jgi:hypothetical protein
LRATATRQFDGGRQRCVGCGHPRKEHKDKGICSVPKCACRDYALPGGKAMAVPATEATTV